MGNVNKDLYQLARATGVDSKQVENTGVPLHRYDEWPTKEKVQKLSVGDHVFYPLPPNYHKEDDLDTRLKKLHNLVKARLHSARTKRTRVLGTGKKSDRGYAYHPELVNTSYRILTAHDYDGHVGIILFRHEDRPPTDIKVKHVAKHDGYGNFKHKPYQPKPFAAE